MTATQPTYYNIGQVKGTGMDQDSIWKAIYNLYMAVYAICYNIDDDSGSTGTDYLSCIGTDLATAMAKLATPTTGPTT
jgi:hypothetical protein